MTEFQSAEGRRRKGKLRAQWMVGVRRRVVSKNLTDEDAEDTD